MSSPASGPGVVAPARVITVEDRTRARRAVVASSIGNALEWFDIIVYSSFAVVISALFFQPAGSQGGQATGILLTFGTFAVSYLIRPLGAMVLGSYADRHGRKGALTLTIMLMMVGTLIMACAPTTAVMGPAAALVILVARLIQGFSAGGEFGTATAFLIENAPDKKAYYGSWQVATQGVSMFLASVFGFTLNTFLSHDALYSWGWRVPFFFGLLIGPIGLYIRLKMDETPDFDQARGNLAKSPLRATLIQAAPRWLTCAAVVGLASVSVYLILFMPTYAVQNLHLPSYAGYLGGIISGIVTLIGAPLAGKLADRIGPVRVMMTAAVIAVVVAYPLFAILVASPSVAMLTAVQVVLGVLMAMYFAPLPALLSDMFPTNIRTTGMSISYNVGVTLFGGFAPLILAWLVTSTGSLMAPSYYYIAIALISLAGLVVMRRTFGKR
ncbi:MFS transporter [Arthrobacter sp. H14-L1]|uniref:MFS transporter n=1 Tax=Arthrobacter sp. H14-L1 TaxID=2996697 RepID=UPI002270DB26|nr:MFS transporter [Arthrobacter sp. H14-L1]MCY0906062.1 MFS transporter [Arthrobacter sp. H14-L1]